MASMNGPSHILLLLLVSIAAAPLPAFAAWTAGTPGCKKIVTRGHRFVGRYPCEQQAGFQAAITVAGGGDWDHQRSDGTLLAEGRLSVPFPFVDPTNNTLRLSADLGLLTTPTGLMFPVSAGLRWLAFDGRFIHVTGAAEFASMHWVNEGRTAGFSEFGGRLGLRVSLATSAQRMIENTTLAGAHGHWGAGVEITGAYLGTSGAVLQIEPFVRVWLMRLLARSYAFEHTRVWLFGFAFDSWP